MFMIIYTPNIYNLKDTYLYHDILNIIVVECYYVNGLECDMWAIRLVCPHHLFTVRTAVLRVVETGDTERDEAAAEQNRWEDHESENTKG